MRWLHLCDLHLGKADEAQTIAMGQLVSSIAKAVDHTSMDLVIFAGDLAYSGTAAEYDALLATVVEPLRQIPEIQDAIFVSVPGNHDLNCHGTYPITWSTLGSHRRNMFWNTDDEGRELRLNRAKGFESYQTFLRNAGIRGPNPLTEVGFLIEVPGPDPVSLICLNTALFSDKDLTESEERGKSPLPVHTLRQLAQGAEPGATLVVVGHHPLNWFEAQSKRQFQAALAELSAFYLHGHEHHVDVVFGSNFLRSLGFGASYPARLDSTSKQPYTSTFAICVLADQLHVQFTSWDAPEGMWRPLHTLPADLKHRSDILLDGYTIPIPTTPNSTVPTSSRVSFGRHRTAGANRTSSLDRWRSSEIVGDAAVPHRSN